MPLDVTLWRSNHPSLHTGVLAGTSAGVPAAVHKTLQMLSAPVGPGACGSSSIQRAWKSLAAAPITYSYSNRQLPKKDVLFSVSGASAIQPEFGAAEAPHESLQDPQNMGNKSLCLETKKTVCGGLQPGLPNIPAGRSPG